MPYRHFGNIGDVWKHLALCEILQVQQPAWYIETNSAYPEYQLSPTPEKTYGIYTFLERASERGLLQHSPYVKLEAAALRSGRYLGSPGLALHLLRGKGNFTFWDLEAEALQAIEAYKKEYYPDASLSLHHGDAIEGMRAQLEKGLPGSAFLHIDPYDMLEPNAQGHCFWELFAAAVRQGVPTFLWYGYQTLGQQRQLRDLFEDLRQRFPVSLGEIWLPDLIGEENALANPGILGAGVAVAHLAPQALWVMQGLLENLSRAYEGSYFDGRYPGNLSRQWIG